MIEVVIRIALRYLIGGVFMGSIAMGDQFASDPDLVAFFAFVAMAAIEGWYAFAKRFNRTT